MNKEKENKQEVDNLEMLIKKRDKLDRFLLKNKFSFKKAMSFIKATTITLGIGTNICGMITIGFLLYGIYTNNFSILKLSDDILVKYFVQSLVTVFAFIGGTCVATVVEDILDSRLKRLNETIEEINQNNKLLQEKELGASKEQLAKLREPSFCEVPIINLKKDNRTTIEVANDGIKKFDKINIDSQNYPAIPPIDMQYQEQSHTRQKLVRKKDDYRKKI